MDTHSLVSQTPVQTLHLFRVQALTPSCPFIHIRALTSGVSGFWSPPACWFCTLEVHWQVTHMSYQRELCECSSPDLRLSCIELLQTCGIPSTWLAAADLILFAPPSPAWSLLAGHRCTHREQSGTDTGQTAATRLGQTSMLPSSLLPWNPPLIPLHFPPPIHLDHPLFCLLSYL